MLVTNGTPGFGGVVVSWDSAPVTGVAHSATFTSRQDFKVPAGVTGAHPGRLGRRRVVHGRGGHGATNPPRGGYGAVIRERARSTRATSWRSTPAARSGPGDSSAPPVYHPIPGGCRRGSPRSRPRAATAGPVTVRRAGAAPTRLPDYVGHTGGGGGAATLVKDTTAATVLLNAGGGGGGPGANHPRRGLPRGGTGGNAGSPLGSGNAADGNGLFGSGTSTPGLANGAGGGFGSVNARTASQRRPTPRGNRARPAAAVAAATASDRRITFSALRIEDASTLTAQASAPAGIPAGIYDLTVAEGAASATCSGCLRVKATPAPTAVATGGDAPAPTGAPALAAAMRPGVTTIVRAPAAIHGNQVRFTVRCAGGACAGTTTATAHGKTVAALPFTLAPGTTRTLTLRLNATGRAQLARARTLPVRATILQRRANAAAQVLTRVRLTLRTAAGPPPLNSSVNPGRRIMAAPAGRSCCGIASIELPAAVLTVACLSSSRRRSVRV